MGKKDTTNLEIPLPDQQRDQLATAQWAEPFEFAEKHEYQEGDIWIGRSPVTGGEIGYSDDRHVLMASGTRSGKGASVIINNLCTWPGSMVVLDPKGENASITAARRGNGSDYCTGMKQSVHVLDPFGEAVVKNEHRSRYNPLDAISIDDPRCIDDTMRIVNAIILKTENSNSKFWDLTSQDLLQGLILHVKTHPNFEGKRNLGSVREILTHGEQEAVDLLKAQQPDKQICPFDMLWERMRRNTACDGLISGIGKRVAAVKAEAPETYQGIWQNCISETKFLDSPAIKDITASSDFGLEELKINPKGISVYLCLSLADTDIYFKWLRVMITMIVNTMQKTKGRPQTGHQTLMCLDEFACLERMKIIEDSVAQLAGYGLKMFFIVQDFGQLKGIYEGKWETFMSNSGLKLFFGFNDHLMTMKHISETLGETEVRYITRSATENKTQTTGKTTGETVGTSEADQEGSSTGTSKTYTISNSKATGHTVQENWSQQISEARQEGINWSKAQNESTSKNRSFSGGRAKSKNSGRGEARNYNTGHFGIAQALRGISPIRTDHSAGLSFQDGSGTSRQTGWQKGFTHQSGTTHQKGGSASVTNTNAKTSGGGKSSTVTTQSGDSTAKGDTRQESRSKTRTSNQSNSIQRSTQESLAQSMAIQEHIQPRPLASVNELKKLFAPISDQNSEHYPGYCLVMLADQDDPISVKRTLYYRDSHFTGYFDPHPDWPEYAPPRFNVDLALPGFPVRDFFRLEYPDLSNAKIEWSVAPGEMVSAGAKIARVGPFNFERHPLRSEALREVRNTDKFREFRYDIEIEPAEGAFYLWLRTQAGGSLSSTNQTHVFNTLTTLNTNQRLLQEAVNKRPIPPLSSLLAEYLQNVEDLTQAKIVQERRRIREEAEKKRRAREAEEKAEKERLAKQAEEEQLAREAEEKRQAKEAEERWRARKAEERRRAREAEERRRAREAEEERRRAEAEVEEKKKKFNGIVLEIVRNIIIFIFRLIFLVYILTIIFSIAIIILFYVKN